MSCQQVYTGDMPAYEVDLSYWSCAHCHTSDHVGMSGVTVGGLPWLKCWQCGVSGLYGFIPDQCTAEYPGFRGGRCTMRRGHAENHVVTRGSAAIGMYAEEWTDDPCTLALSGYKCRLWADHSGDHIVYETGLDEKGIKRG